MGFARDAVFRQKIKNSFILFIDLKAAYDSVNHQILFAKLKDKGFTTNVINFIKLLYNNAFTKVDLNSEKIPINVGVVQGSVISPILFDLYIDDLVS